MAVRLRVGHHQPVMSLAAQLSLVGPDLQISAAEPLSVQHGEVFTRPWVVDLILDLVGYTPDRDLAALRAVEPACGTGAFLGSMVRRLSASARRHGRRLEDCRDALLALDLLPENAATAWRLVFDTLAAEGWQVSSAAASADAWVRSGDYLTQHDLPPADLVVGNPPYIRLEEVPEARMAVYRRVCPTMVGRADIYVGFFEQAIRSLKPGGRLGFICADRWMRNQYGRLLRRLVSRHCSVDVVISMHDVDAFEEEVSAYPAIVVLRRQQQGAAVVADATSTFGPNEAERLTSWVRSGESTPFAAPGVQADRLPHWFPGDESWPAGSPQQLRLLESLNDRFSPLEDVRTRTRVGIGVATGADDVFVTKDRTTVEPDRLLPLAMVTDTRTGHFQWSGHYLVNPWDRDGQLVRLSDFPQLAAYLHRTAQQLRRRNVAARQPQRWFRTIDKVDHRLTTRAKLLFPDMKQSIHPVLETGGHYPHHNLYYVVSEGWDLEVLGGLLLSRVAQSFVSSYAVRMRGGTLRFQAQYLRRIRVPAPEAIHTGAAAQLRQAFQDRNVDVATDVAARLYGVDVAEFESAR